MTSLDFGRGAFGLCAAAAMLTGCDGSQPPIGSPGAMPQSRLIASDAASGKSWMLPEAKSDDLVYVSGTDRYGGQVFVYTYPAGGFVGHLAGFETPSGECVDKSGDVFITDMLAKNIVEYPHGGTTPIATLNDPGHPNGCAIDPTTGSLAVTNAYGSQSSSRGNVVIYRNARGKPRRYSDAPLMFFYSYCGYDDAGDLFVDGGSDYTRGLLLAELPKNRKTFTNIGLDRHIPYAGGVQWDGKYVALGNGSTRIYRFAISGGSGTTIGTVNLKYARTDQFWIQGRQVIVPSSGLNYEAIWNYPGGGNAFKKLKRYWRNHHEVRFGPFGATVSLAPH